MRNPTPRSMRSPSQSPGRGIGTLIGNGWLRESPRNAGWGQSFWHSRSKSALRKCMFMPVPDAVRALLPVSPAAMPPYAPPRPPELRAEDVVPHRRNARHDVQQFAAFPNKVVDPRAIAQQAHAYHVHNAQKAAAAAAVKPPMAWWEDPVALGSLLILVPPVGLAAVWASKRYSSDARWALTVMTALTMCLLSAVVIVLSMH